VGTGPYKFVEFVPDEHIVLARNEDYWSDAYLLDTIEFVEMQEDSTRMAALEAGEVDVADALPIDQAQRLESAGFVVAPVTAAEIISILLETELQREEYPFLSDQQVRQALNYAVNKQELVDALTGGYGRPTLGTFVGPDGFGYDPDFSMYEYDPDRARQMLADAGYPDGFTFRLPYAVARYAYGDEIVAAVASYLAEVGVTMVLEPMENAAWTEQYLAGELPTTLFAPNYTPTMDVDRILFICSSDFPRKWVQGNPEFDELFKQERSILDADERLPVLQAAARKCAEMAPLIFTIYPPEIYGYNTRVQNISFRSDGLFDLAGVYVDR
jgi:peptide/nickel transport system substrate-binding protein